MKGLGGVSVGLRGRGLRTRHLLGAICAVLLAALGLAWSLASPPMSSPDDDFHLASIWCAWGQEASQCRVLREPDSSQPLEVDVDPLGPYVSDCMAFRPETSGSCIFVRPDGSIGLVADRNYPARANNGGYPGLFYDVMRLLVFPDVQRSIVAMRWVNFMLAAGLIIAASSLLTVANRSRVRLAVLIASVPLGLFIFASTNPSSWAASGTVAVFLAVVAGLSDERSKRQLISGALAGLAMLLACGARPDSFYFCLIALMAGLAVGRVWRIRDRRRLIRALLVPLVGIVVAFLARPGSISGSVGPKPQPQPDDLTGNFLQVLAFYVGDFATSLGWVDTRMPALVWGCLALALGGLLTLGMAELDRGKVIALALVGGAALVLPLYLLNLWGATIFVEIQPRYFLGLLLAGMALAVMRLPHPTLGWSAGQVALLGVLAGVAHTFALQTLLRRYVAGLDVVDFNLNAIAEWWWLIPGGPNLVWAVGSLSYIGVIAILGLLITRNGKPGALDREPSEQALAPDKGPAEQAPPTVAGALGDSRAVPV